MKEKILAVDGHSMLNRAFYGLPDLTSGDGRHTGAVLGFLNILLKVLDEEKPQYLAVAFDLPAPTFRHKMYPEYKGTRHPMPEELREQVPLMKEVLAAMGVLIITKEGYEADDILGTVSRKSEGSGRECTILSGDRDLLQLATDNTMIRIPKTKGGQTEVHNYHAADVLTEYGITPDQVVEIKALEGDSSDNIPGLPGVGVKTATRILQQFGTAENAHEHLDEIRPKKAMEAMRDHWDLAELSRKLAKIDTDIPIDIDWDKARLGDLFTPEAYSLFKELGFRNLLSRFGAEVTEDRKIPDVKILKDLGEIEEVFHRSLKASCVGMHMLSSFDGHEQKSHISGLALALSADEIYYIPVNGFVSENFLRMTVSEISSRSGGISVYDLKNLLKSAEIRKPEKCFDILIAAYLLDPLLADYPFDAIAGKYTDECLVLAPSEIFGEKKIPSPADMPEEKAALYAGEIAYTALAAKDPMYRSLKEHGMARLFDDLEMPLVFTLRDMERNGIICLPGELKSYGDRLEAGIEELEKKIYDEAGEKFNINSPKQLGVILFEKMNLPGGKKTKTGYSTSADVLEKLAPYAPVVQDILNYRQLAKLKSTYADGLYNFISADGRIHTTFNQTITATGRISSTDPNLQNIPIRIDLGRQIRKAFVPEEGCVFIDADYSQIELRVLAAMSGDQRLIEAYREAKDIHRITASQVFHVPFDEVTPIQRRNAKAVNFGIIYGISAFGLAKDLNIPQKEAAEYIKAYYEAYPGIKAYLEGLVDSAKKKGYTETLYGRRRPMPELASGNFMQRQFGERVARNAPIQGTAADIIKIAMNRVDRRLKKEHMKSRLLVQVHDELLIEAPAEEEEKARQILEEEMTGAADLAVKLEVDIHSGKNWYEAK